MTDLTQQDLPDELTDRAQWMCWKQEQRDGEPTKIPINPHTGRYGDSTDPESWCDFQTAKEYAANNNAIEGLGFVFSENGTVAGVDLDDVRDLETGAPTDTAKEIITELDSYTEVSPSRTGYHVFVNGFVFGDNREDFEDCDGHIEMYDSGRFFTITGTHVEGTPEVVNERAGVLQDVHEEYIKDSDDDADTEPEPKTPVDLDEQELLEKAKSASNGEQFQRLWRGDWSDYESHSEADLALCSHLAFWTGGERERIDGLFRRSGLIRDKWDEDRGAQTYGERTIEKALEGQSDYYDPESATENEPNLDVVSTADSEQKDTESEDLESSVDFTDLQGTVIEAIEEQSAGDIQVQTARHRIAKALTKAYHFVLPEREVRGWRETLYVYNDDEGIYEPRGETVIKRKLERVAGDWITNQRVSEIVAKVKRMSVARGEQFEVPPNRLVVGNGVLDLHTGDLHEYSPYEYQRTKIDVNWNPEAGDPEAIDSFLHDIVDNSDVPTLYRLIAHTLYKEYVTEKAAMLIGGGQNGKSLFLDFVQEFLGQHNVSHRALQDFEEQFSANQLQGKLANIHPDMGDHAVKDLSTFKKLTGRDSFTADVKFESPITFENYATLLFAANEMPVFGEDNHAVWRRWVYLEFPYEFRADKPDAKNPRPKQELMQELTDEEELEALLLRAQQEIERWYDGEEWFADAMRPEAVREKMKKAAEPVYAFATTCLDSEEDGAVPKATVREAYHAYADAEDLPRVPENEFGKRLMELRDFRIQSGQKRIDKQRRHVYTGVELTPRGRQLAGLDIPDDEDQSQMEHQESPRKIVMDTLRDMVDENDGNPVPKNGVVWAAVSNDLAKGRAEHELEKLMKQGDVHQRDDGIIVT